MSKDNEEWTTEKIIANAENWSLAGDIAILNSLKSISETVLLGTNTLNAKVDDLLNNLELVGLRLDTTKNDFHGLRNLKFIENRVYEDDETSDPESNKIDNKEPEENGSTEDAIKNAILNDLKIVDKYYDKVEVAISDSEGEPESNEKSYILQPKDPYISRPLPYIVGSDDWVKSRHIGLLLSDSESEQEQEPDVYSSSDSESYLPKNKTMDSETRSELEQRRDLHSLDDTSNHSNSVPTKAPISSEQFAEQLVSKLDNVITSNKVNSESVANSSNYGSLFSDQPPPLDDFYKTIPAKPVQESLFGDGHNIFAEDNSLPCNTSNKPVEEDQNDVNSTSPRAATRNTRVMTRHLIKIGREFFSDSDSSSEEDIIAYSDRRKRSTIRTSRYLPPPKTTLRFLPDQPPEISSKSEPQNTKKKPVGGVSMFGEHTDIFNEKLKSEPKREESVSKIEDISSEIKPEATALSTKPVKKISLFSDSLDSSDSESIFSSRKEPANRVATENPTTKILRSSLFDDLEDSVDSTPSFGGMKSSSPSKTATVKKISLFDDDEGDDALFKEEEDIFSGFSKKKIGKDQVKPEKDVIDFLNVSTDFSDLNLHQSETPKKSEELFADGAKGSETIEKSGVTDVTESHSEKRSASLAESGDDKQAETTEVLKDTEKENDLTLDRATFETAKRSNENLVVDNSNFESNLGEAKETDVTTKTEGESERSNEEKLDVFGDPIQQDLTEITPPSINLFDPRPPPVDLAALSDDSAESDKMSWLEGISEHNYENQSQLTSSIFDEAPPNLPVNNISSQFEHVKPSTSLRLENDDLFSNVETVEEDSKNAEVKTIVRSLSQKLEESKEEVLPIISSSASSIAVPGKLKHNIDINVKALLPGASPFNTRPSTVKPSESVRKQSESPELLPNDTSTLTGESSSIKVANREISTFRNDGEISSFDELGNTEILRSVTKDRAKMPIKRKPSRKARREAGNLNATDATGGSVSTSQDGGMEKHQDRKDSSAVEEKQSSFLFNPLEGPDTQLEDEGLFSTSSLVSVVKEIQSSNVGTSLFNAPQSSSSPLEDGVIFSTHKKDLKEGLPSDEKTPDVVFKERDTDSKYVTKTSLSSDSVEEIVKSQKPTSSGLFSDKSDSDTDIGLFSSKPRLPKTDQPKKSLFASSDDDGSEDDLFGTKSSKVSGVVATRTVREIPTAKVKKLENKEVTDFDPLSSFK